MFLIDGLVLGVMATLAVVSVCSEDVDSASDANDSAVESNGLVVVS